MINWRYLPLLLSQAALLFGATAGAQAASTFPDRPINIVVGAAPGGPTDATARILGDRMGAIMGVPVVVVNKGGGGGVIASQYVAQQAADGYTLLMGSVSTHGINPTLYRKLGYDAIQDFTPISEVVSYPLVLIVNPKSVPVANLKEFIDFARKKGGSLNRASAGNGTSMHLAGELFNHMAGTKLNHVPYKGSAPAMQALLAGQVDVDFESLTVALAHIRSGDVKALGVTGAERSPLLPDVPAIAEVVPGYESIGWLGLLAPAGTPPDVVRYLHQRTVQALADPEVKKKLLGQAMQPIGSSPEAFGKFIKDQIKSLGEVVHRSGAVVQ